MALRDTRNDNYNSGLSASDYKGFSIDAYRKANKLSLILVKNGGSPVTFFQAFYTGEFNYVAALSTSSFAQQLLEKMNGLGAIWRSSLQSVGQSVFGEKFTGAFDAPYKPYIQGTEPLSFDLQCELPILARFNKQGGIVHDVNFIENIQKPLNTLLKVVLPEKNKVFKDVSNTLGDAADSAIDWLFNDTDSQFWTTVQNVIEGYKKDFLSGIYALDVPLQFNNANLVLRIGPWRVSPVLIENLKVSFSPMIYTDGNNVYPSKCTINITCKTLNKATVDSMNIGNDYDKSI